MNKCVTTELSWNIKNTCLSHSSWSSYTLLHGANDWFGNAIDRSIQQVLFWVQGYFAGSLSIQFDIFLSKGRQNSSSVDCSRSYPIQEVYHRLWCLELWSLIMGDHVVRGKTLLGLGQLWGIVQWIIRSPSLLLHFSSKPTPRTLSHKSSFIPRTRNLWNVLPSSCLPEFYSMQSSKFKVNKLDQISLSS